METDNQPMLGEIRDGWIAAMVKCNDANEPPAYELAWLCYLCGRERGKAHRRTCPCREATARRYLVEYRCTCTDCSGADWSSYSNKPRRFLWSARLQAGLIRWWFRHTLPTAETRIVKVVNR